MTVVAVQAERGKRFSLIAFFALLYLAATLSLARSPQRQFFDEECYAGECANSSFRDVLRLRDHPPLGFAIICAGVRFVGNNPLGWRISSALMGALGIAVVLATLHRVGVRTSMLAVAGVLLATDPLLLVLGRTSMLDTTLFFFFALAAELFLRSVDDSEREGLWLTLCGIAVGAACTVKWSGALLPASFAVYYAFSQRDYQRMHIDRRVVLTLFVLPVVVFVLLHRLLGFEFRQFLTFMYMKIRHHVAYSPIGVVPLTSRASDWLLLQKPVPLIAPQFAGTGGPIVATENPITHLAWLALAAWIPFRKDLRNVPAIKFGLLFAAVQLFGWAIAPRITFLYYLITIVPFLMMSFVVALDALPRTLRKHLLLAVFLLTQTLYTIYLYPVLSGRHAGATWDAALRQNPLLASALQEPPPVTCNTQPPRSNH